MDLQTVSFILKMHFQEKKFCLWNFANLLDVQRMQMAWKIPPAQFKVFFYLLMKNLTGVRHWLPLVFL